MILRSWADRLLDVSAPSEVIDLHVRDVVASFCTGLRTNDGRAIVRRHGGSRDPAELAATISAITRLSECDDIYLPCCVTPGAIVIPVALAFTGDCNSNDFETAVSAGSAAGLLLGSMIGGAHALARGIWPTLFAAPVMAAVTASVLTTRDPEQVAHALALTLASADGRVGNPAERWTLLADAVRRGVRTAKAVANGARGDLDLLPVGFDRIRAAGVLDGALDGIAHVAFKPFPIARQGANAVVALQRLLSRGVDPKRIDTIEVFVPAINVALLNRPVFETDRLSRLCNMGLQLAAAALAPDVLYDPERIVQADLAAFARRGSVSAASDLEDPWPYRWAARVVVRAGREQVEETVIQAPFDHDAPGLLHLLQEKWRRMLSEDDLTLLNLGQPGSARYATLWQQVERRLRAPAED